jgi:hypothetical protein
MLLLAPEIVRFESHAWDDVASLAIDRAAKRIIEEHSDLGPFATFADVPEQSITIRVQRRITADDLDDPPLGEAGELTFSIGPPAAALARKRITVSCVLTSIRSDLPSAKPATRTLTFLATSDGATDPITTTIALLAE